MNPPRDPVIFQKHYRDYDDFVQTIRAWNLDFVQLEKRPFSADLFQCITDPAQISHAKFSTATLQRGDPPPRLQTMAVMAQPPESIFRWRRQQVPFNAVMLFPPGEELEAVTHRGGAEVFTLSFAEELLDDVAASMHLDLKCLVDGCALVHTDPITMQGLRHFLYRLCRDLRDPQMRPSTAALRSQLAGELPERLLHILADARDEKPNPPPSLRHSAMSSILDTLEAHPREPYSVPDLCRIAGASERTLRYAFQDRFGVSPKRYLLAWRLNGAHKELQQSPSQQPGVTLIAHRWGFHHLSQFATDYRCFFGERPSETLKRRT